MHKVYRIMYEIALILFILLPDLNTMDIYLLGLKKIYQRI